MTAQERLRAVMKKRGWTQKRLAAELGVSPQWVSQIMRGGTSPNVELATAIEKLTGGAVRPRHWAEPADT